MPQFQETLEVFSWLSSLNSGLNCSSTQSVENIYLFRLRQTSSPDYKSDVLDDVILAIALDGGDSFHANKMRCTLLEGGVQSCHKIDIEESRIYWTKEESTSELHRMQPRKNVEKYILSRHSKGF